MTKQIEKFQAQEKSYTRRFLLGATTHSYDLETAIDNTFDLLGNYPPNGAGYSSAIHRDNSTATPLFSAIKKDGERLYEKHVEENTPKFLVVKLPYTSLR